MSTEIVLAVIAIVAVPLTSWLTSKLDKRKYDAEISKLKAEIENMKAEVNSKELDNVRQGADILMEQIVAPLKQELKILRTDVNKFRRAVEKIPACDHSDNCPVSRELYNAEKGDNKPAAHSKGRT